MKLWMKFSLVLSVCVVSSVFFATLTQAGYFTSDQAAYLEDFQSTQALSMERQLETRMILLHTQLQGLLDADSSNFQEAISTVPGVLAAELLHQDKLLASFPKAHTALARVPGRGKWSLVRVASGSEAPSLLWVGHYGEKSVALKLSAEWFKGILESSHGITSEIVTPEGTALLRSGNSLEEAQSAAKQITISEMFRLPPHLPTTRKFSFANEVEALGTFLRLATDPPLMIVVATPWSVVQAVINRTYRQSLIICVLFLIFSVAIGILFSRHMTSPLHSLAKQALQVAVGRFDGPPVIGDRRQDELGLVSRSFNTMAKELKKLRDELRKTERQVAFGKFSSSLAHEIKNPLAIIQGHAQLVQRAHETPGALDVASVAQSLKYVVEETKRANRIINRLMMFARHDPRPTSIIDLAERVRKTLSMMKPEFEQGQVELATDLPKGSSLTMADEDQIHEVLLNLLQNALYAVKQSQAKKIRVTLAEQSSFWVLTLEDSGSGIAQEVQEHLFEPFFTTKPIGQGTGLGLAVCHGIVTNHGGTIEVKSQIDRGTQFTIRLPTVASLPNQQAA